MMMMMMICHAHTLCVSDYPVPSPVRILFCKTDVCSYARSDCNKSWKELYNRSDTVQQDKGK